MVSQSEAAADEPLLLRAKYDPVGGKELMTANKKHNSVGTSDNCARAGEAESEVVCSDMAPDATRAVVDGEARLAVPADPDLALVIAAWLALPADVRANIVAMVKAAVKG